MNQNTRQRIIGTAVLALVAIIVLPLLFDGEGSYQPPLQTDIPAVPQRPDASRQVPERPVITADTDAIRIREPISEVVDDAASDDQVDETVADTQAAASDAITSAAQNDNTDGQASRNDSAQAPETTAAASPPAAQADTPATQSTIEPRLDINGLPEAWSVRVGSFASQTNAANLVSRLQNDGHRAYSRPVQSSQGPLTAVFVGPLVDRSAAQALLEQMRQNYQLNGMIVRYEIEER